MSTSQTQSSRRIDVGYEVSLTASGQTVCLVGGPHDLASVACRGGLVNLGIEILEERATPGYWGSGMGVVIRR